MSFTNNLLHHVNSLFWPNSVLTNYFQNNLFIRGEVYVTAWSTNELVFQDNLFDKTILSNSMDTANGYNGYLAGHNRLSPTGPTDVILTSSVYEKGPLSRYYLPTNSPLVDAGSVTNASQKGFYWHTSFTNQTLEAATRLNIGKLWIALSNGVPVDTDSDGLASYLEDANGNGSKETTETDFNNWDTDGDGVSDYLEALQGRNPLSAGTSSDSGNVIKLRVYTPLE